MKELIHTDELTTLLSDINRDDDTTYPIHVTNIPEQAKYIFSLHADEDGEFLQTQRKRNIDPYYTTVDVRELPSTKEEAAKLLKNSFGFRPKEILKLTKCGVRRT